MRISDWSSDVCSSDLGLFVSMNSPGKEGAAGAIRSALFHEFADRYLPGEAVPAARVDAKTPREHAAILAGPYVQSRGSFTKDRTSGVSGKSVSVRVDSGGSSKLHKKQITLKHL